MVVDKTNPPEVATIETSEHEARTVDLQNRLENGTLSKLPILELRNWLQDEGTEGMSLGPKRKAELIEMVKMKLNHDD